MDSNQCCQVLGVSSDSSFKEVKAAYRRLALKYHPDRNKDDKNGATFKRVTEAYQILRFQYKKKIGRVSPYESNHTSTMWSEERWESNSESSHYGGNGFDSNGGQHYKWQHDSWWEAPKDDYYDNDNDPSSSARKTYSKTEYDWEEFRRQTENAYKDFWSYQEDDDVFSGDSGGFRGKQKRSRGQGFGNSFASHTRDTNGWFGNTRNKNNNSSSSYYYGSGYAWFFNKVRNNSRFRYYDNYQEDVDEDTDVNQDVENAVSVNVDESLCIGCCSCETIAPEVFYVDKHKRWNPKSNVINEKGNDSETIMDAAQTCPTKAIGVKKKKTDEPLFPL